MATHHSPLRSRLAVAIGGTAVAALALTGCTAPTSDDDSISVVASTDVYGDIAEMIGGDLIDVTSIISGNAQDPHSYEATAQDQLALAKADIVIENGGGYDPFIDTMLSASGEDIHVISASEVSGLMPGDEHDHSHDDEESDEHEHAEDEHEEEGHEGHDHIEGFNEHVWYSFHAMEHLAEALAEELSELDAANASSYEANLGTFLEGIDELEAQATSIRDSWEGTAVAITEPVPLYLFEDAGLVNLTPEAFSEAVEEGTDVAPSVLLETTTLVENGDVALLAINEQTAGAESERLREAAELSGVGVISLTETLPDGEDYFSWMADNMERLAQLLQESA